MKLRLEFGFKPPKFETWYWGMKNIPPVISYLGSNWEFAMYNVDPQQQVDYICIFAEINYYDPRWNQPFPSYEETFGGATPVKRKEPGCECGAHHTEFPQHHMFFCPKWTDIMNGDKK